MRVVITGGNGYLGKQLVRTLVQKGALNDAAGNATPIDEIVVYGRSTPTFAGIAAGGIRLRHVAGSVGDLARLREVLAGDAVSVFHLAAVLTGVTERDVEAALDVNAEGTRNVLRALGEGTKRNRLVMTSSLLAYSRNAKGVPVDARTPTMPRTIYGMSKVIAEQIARAYSRAGRVDARGARISTVVIRPRKVGSSAGASISDILREVSLGAHCDVLLDRATEVAIIDYRSCIDGLIGLHDVDRDALGDDCIVDFPALTTTVDALLEAAGEAARRHGRAPGPAHAKPDAFAQTTIDTWPTLVDPERAQRLGIAIDQDLGRVIDRFLEDYDGFWSAALAPAQDATKGIG